MKKSSFSIYAVILAVCLMSSFATANDFSFTGLFHFDNDVQAFGFTVGATSNVTLKSLGYAGGTNSAGQAISRGGFDTILAVWDSNGNMVGSNDDGFCLSQVKLDPTTGQCYDAALTVALGVGNYTVTVMQYDNFAKGTNLASGFRWDGPANIWFTDNIFPGGCVNHFEDSSDSAGRCRTDQWAFDILNVNQATQVTAAPEPGSLALLGSGIIGLAGTVRRKLIAR
jgi:hypothetical protein